MRPIVLPYGDGGAIISWNDTRNGSSNRDIYAQRIGSSGAAVWSNIGIAVCTAANDQDWANPISDGAGGAIISWEDERAGGINRNVYAQRVNTTGTVQWIANGVAISTASGYKSFSQILPVGSGDGIITWGDERSGATIERCSRSESTTTEHSRAFVFRTRFLLRLCWSRIIRTRSIPRQ